MADHTRRTFMLGLFAVGLAVTVDAEARGGRSGRRSDGGGGRSKGGKGGYGSGGSGGDDSGCDSRVGPGGPRDKDGKCPRWQK